MEKGCAICQEQVRNQVLPIIKQNGRDSAMLIQILHETQEKIGYLPQDVQQIIADELHMPLAEVYSVVSFYARFTTVPLGKHRISLCMGTACYVKGSEQLLERLERLLGVSSGQTTKDGQFTLESCRCVGACGLAPVMSVDEHVFGNLKPDMIDGIIAQFSAEEQVS